MSRPTVSLREVQSDLDAVLAIEAQQDDLLRRLEELNARIERVLAEHAPAAGPPRPAGPQAA